MVLAILILAWLVTKAITDGRIDHTYAKQGLVSPRLEVKYGSKASAKAATARYGLSDHVKDAWSDHWQRRTEAVVAARDAKPAEPGGRVRLRDRLAAAAVVVRGGVKSAADHPVVRRLVAPAGEAAPEPPAAERSAPPVASPDLPPGSWTVDDNGQRVPLTPAEPPTKSEPSPPPNGATPMTAPTGEAVNYETTVAELEAEITEMQTQVDAATAAKDAIGNAEAAIDAMQQNYRATALAAQSKLDHETALNLDGTTLSHAGTTVDALPPNAVDEMYAHLEAMKAQVTERLEQSATALGSLEAELAHVQATYGDAHATVAGNLSGDSRFLDSAAPEPARAA